MGGANFGARRKNPTNKFGRALAREDQDFPYSFQRSTDRNRLDDHEVDRVS